MKWPDGVPSDILSTANQCAAIWHHEFHHDYQILAQDFAKALLEERERCALYLEKRAEGLWVDYDEKESSELVEDIAFEIRSGRHME